MGGACASLGAAGGPRARRTATVAATLGVVQRPRLHHIFQQACRGSAGAWVSGHGPICLISDQTAGFKAPKLRNRRSGFACSLLRLEASQASTGVSGTLLGPPVRPPLVPPT